MSIVQVHFLNFKPHRVDGTVCKTGQKDDNHHIESVDAGEGRHYCCKRIKTGEERLSRDRQLVCDHDNSTIGMCSGS
jgi:hypothetical protein